MKNYEQNELARHRIHLQRVEEAPLADRQAARASYASATVDHIEEAVGHLLAGNFGFGPYLAAREEVLGFRRRNGVAMLAMWAAAYEWQCPAAFARQAFRKWSPDKQARVNEAIERLYWEELETLEDMAILLQRLDKGTGIPGRGSDQWEAAKASGYARRDANGNSKLTRKGKLRLEDLKSRGDLNI